MLRLCCAYPIVNGLRAKSLEGNWRPEMLFVLKQEVEMYDTYQRRIRECDQELEAHLKRIADKIQQKPAEDGSAVEAQKRTSKPPGSGKRVQGNAPCFDLRS